MEYDKFLIITSNGVWEYMSNDDVLNLTINKKNSQEFCEDNERYPLISLHLTFPKKIV